jgi:hypothetical protein
MPAASSPRNQTTLVVVGIGLAIITELLVLQTVSSGLSPRTTVETSLGLGRIYTAMFLEGTTCGGPARPTMWGVKLGNVTKTEPPTVTLSEIEDNGLSDYHFNQTAITFLVPSGAYPFILYPSLLHIASADGSAAAGPTGVVTVSDLNVTLRTVDVSMCT